MTTALPRGRKMLIRVAPQASFDAAAATGFVQLAAYAHSFLPASEPQDDDVLGGFANSIDDRPAAPDIEDGSGRIEWAFDMAQVGWILRQVFGAPVTTGTGPYVHTFGASETIPDHTLEREIANGAQYDGVIGAVARQITFGVGSDKGYRRLPVEYVARQVVDQYAASIAGAFATPTLSNRVPAAVGSLKRDGAAMGSILSGDIVIQNEIEMDRYDGDRLNGAAFLTGRKVAVNLQARFLNATLRDLGKIATGQYLPGVYSIERTYELSASLKLVITCANVRFAKAGLEVSNGKHTTVPLRGRAEVSAAAAAVTCVLTNSTASYA